MPKVAFCGKVYVALVQQSSVGYQTSSYPSKPSFGMVPQA